VNSLFGWFLLLHIPSHSFTSEFRWSCSVSRFTDMNSMEFRTSISVPKNVKTGTSAGGWVGWMVSLRVDILEIKWGDSVDIQRP